VKWIQLRVKGKPVEQWKLIARQVQDICRGYQATLIVNDNVEIAREISAQGVHLGLNDMPIDKAREILGPEFIIGGTANTSREVELQLDRGADYIGIGPFRFTETKKQLSPELGLEGIRLLAEQFPDVPLIAVGGIVLQDVNALMGIDIRGIAVSSAINKHPDPQGTARQFLEACEHCHKFQENIKRF
jgi:thiamine-phosphate pyrophosphorylase